MFHFISADWSKNPSKRSVYLSSPGTRQIEPVHPLREFWNLEDLLDQAAKLQHSAPVLIGVDVVLGVSAGYWKRVNEDRNVPYENFLDWLRDMGPSDEFFGTIRDPKDWTRFTPWFAVQKGEGGLRKFTRHVEDGMMRRIDAATGAKPVFAVSGIPGTVGSGTRAFWRELAPRLSGDRDFAIWPFDGSLPRLLAGHDIVLAETYPRLAYAAALHPELPAKLIAIPKSRFETRKRACTRLQQMDWVANNRVKLCCVDGAVACADDFDALLTAAGVLRCQLEGRLLAEDNWIDPKAEGSMLLAGPVDPGGKARRPSWMYD